MITGKGFMKRFNVLLQCEHTFKLDFLKNVENSKNNSICFKLRKGLCGFCCIYQYILFIILYLLEYKNKKSFRNRIYSLRRHPLPKKTDFKDIKLFLGYLRSL